MLEWIYDVTWATLLPFRRWLRAGGKMEWVFVRGERISKGMVFGCKMCGDCVLQSTGMTCPMTCPKNLRNGPCGGVRVDGGCEVTPSMTCVWIEAWERSNRMPRYGSRITSVVVPLDLRLEGTSGWLNDLDETVKEVPVGWSE